MSVTLPASILPTVTSSGTTLPSSVPGFEWSDPLSTINTCTPVTFKWQYSGPQETLQFTLVSNVSPRTNAAMSSGQSTIVATGVDSTALSWTWSKVNMTAGQYVLQAMGTDVNAVTSAPFLIVDGADTSCLAASSTGYPSSTGSATSTSSSSSSTSSSSSPTALPAAASNRSKTGAVAGGVVAGIAVLLAAVAAYVYFGLCRGRRSRSRRRGHGAMEDAPSLGQWGGLSSRDSCMDVMGASTGGKSVSPNKSRHGTTESSAAILTPLSSVAHGHHSSVTTLTATEEEKGVAYGKGYEYIESVPPLGYKANRRRSSASASGLGQLSPIESLPEPPPSAGLQGRLRSKSASQSHRALALAKLDGGDRPYQYQPPSAPRPSIDASTPPFTTPPYDMGFVPPPVNRASSGGGPGARRAVRKPVPALDSAELVSSPSTSPTAASPFAPSPSALSRGQSLASTVTMTSMVQPAPTQASSRSRESSVRGAGALQPPSQGAPTRSRSREDLEAAGVELPTLDHKSSFGDRPVHYLIPDLPPPTPHK